jgi:hypothetical protein
MDTAAQIFGILKIWVPLDWLVETTNLCAFSKPSYFPRPSCQDGARAGAQAIVCERTTEVHNLANLSNSVSRDSRIKALISNGMQEKKRSFFVVVGDRPKDVVVWLNHIMSNVNIKHNKSVLWAYKSKLLGFTRYD